MSYQVEGLVRDDRVEVRVLFGASRELRIRGALLVLELFGRERSKSPPVAFEQPGTNIVRRERLPADLVVHPAADEATHLERLQEAVEAALDDLDVQPRRLGIDDAIARTKSSVR